LVFQLAIFSVDLGQPIGLKHVSRSEV
jgi:hypothetical protein